MSWIKKAKRKIAEVLGVTPDKQIDKDFENNRPERVVPVPGKPGMYKLEGGESEVGKKVPSLYEMIENVKKDKPLPNLYDNLVLEVSNSNNDHTSIREVDSFDHANRVAQSTSSVSAVCDGPTYYFTLRDGLNGEEIPKEIWVKERN